MPRPHRSTFDLQKNPGKLAATTNEVVRRYQQEHQSIRLIASELVLTFGIVRRLLIESGTPMRSRGSRRNPNTARRVTTLRSTHERSG